MSCTQILNVFSQEVDLENPTEQIKMSIIDIYFPLDDVNIEARNTILLSMFSVFV